MFSMLERNGEKRKDKLRLLNHFFISILYWTNSLVVEIYNVNTTNLT